MSGTLFAWVLLNFRLDGTRSLVQSMSCLSCHQMSRCCSGSHRLWVARRRRIFWRWHLHSLTHLMLWGSFFHRLTHRWLFLRFEIQSNLRRWYLLWGGAESSSSSVDLKDWLLRQNFFIHSACDLKSKLLLAWCCCSSWCWMHVHWLASCEEVKMLVVEAIVLILTRLSLTVILRVVLHTLLLTILLHLALSNKVSFLPKMFFGLC